MDNFKKDFGEFLRNLDAEELLADLKNYGYEFEPGNGEHIIMESSESPSASKSNAFNVLEEEIEYNIDNLQVLEMVEHIEASKFTMQSNYSMQKEERIINISRNLKIEIDNKTSVLQNSELKLVAC